MKFPRSGIRIAAVAGALLLAVAATSSHAQGTIKLINVNELSGAGATVGTNFKNGADLAVADINAKGGILGQKVEISHYDTQSNAGTARAQVQKALDENPYAILGPNFSGLVKATAPLVKNAGIAQVMGGEAGELTQMGMPSLFRTSFGQQSSMPKIAKYIADDVKAKSVAVIWVNNDFGKGGRDAIVKDFGARGVKVVADISTESGQADFSADVQKIKQAKPDAVFIYLNEEESARILREIKRQALNVPLLGETTLLSQKVIDLAGDAATGVKGHVGLTTDANIPLVQDFRKRFVAKYNYVPDHNGLKGYIAVYMIKAGTEKIGKVDRKGLSDALHGLSINAKAEPGVLMDVSIDKNGDIDRESFLGEVVNGKQVITKTLPKLNP